MSIIIDKNKYIEFYNILSGCRTLMDAQYFAERYIKLNNGVKNMVLSMINGKRYENVLELNTIKLLIESLNHVEFMDDALDITEQYIDKTTDQTQLKTLSRISKNKIMRTKINNLVNNNNNEITIKKKCPHCFIDCVAIYNTDYIICGYSNNTTGYDLIGCGKDWCFKCEKILCKKWSDNNLFVLSNRQHNYECCKKHAIENKKTYPNDYCNCINNNVCRNNLLFSFEKFL
jgi:hypothetical protein